MMQMPGQAMGMQFAPPQVAGTPAAEIDKYKQVNDLQTLIAMYQREPSMALLARIDEVRKAAQMQQAAQGQNAMQQAAQQPAPVANEVIAQAMQAMGTAPRRMATGGIVALAGGGSLAEPKYENPDFDEEGLPRGATEKAAIIERNRLRQQAFERARQGAPRSLMGVMESAQRVLPTEAISRLTDFPPVGPRGGETPEDRAKIAAQLTGTEALYPEPPAVREGRRAAPPGAAAPPSDARRERVIESTTKTPAATPPAATPSALAQAHAELLKASEAPAVSPELQAQRAKVSGLQALQEQQALSNIRNLSEERTRVGQRRMDRANLPLLEDAQALAALAASIDPRKGRVFGSLGAGLASVLGAQEARKEKAEEYLATQDDRIRSLNNTYQQMQLENAKYQQALLEGDGAKAQASREKITKLKYDAAVKLQELENDRIRADAAQAQARAAGITAGAAAAAVPSRIDAAAQAATARLASVLNNDPVLQGYKKRLEGIISPEDEAALLVKMRARERELRLQYAPELEALRGAGTTSGTDTRAAADKIIGAQ